MNENPFENPTPKQEKFEAPAGPEQLEIKMRIATSEDWKAYKDLRLLEISGKDREMFGSNLKMRIKEKIKSDQQWQHDLSRKDMFILLSLNNSGPVAMSLAAEDHKISEEGVWHIGWAYVKEDFRGKGIQSKMIAARLLEIKARGGKKVTALVKFNNKKSLDNLEAFGFKNVGSSEHDEFLMELGDLDSPELIKKIEEVLNAG